MAKNSGLGKGLDSLIPDVSLEVEQEETISLADLLAKENEEEEEEVLDSVDDIEEAEKEDEIEVSVEDSVEKSLSAEDDKNVKDEVLDSVDEVEELNNSEDNLDDISEDKIDGKDDEILVEKESSEASEKSTKIQEETIKNIEDNQESTKNIEAKSKENDVDVLLSKKDEENVCQVIEIVESNPRITLWSARSAAVLRYLRKTEPEFSISNEASKLIEEALAEKYPEIWTLFDHL